MPIPQSPTMVETDILTVTVQGYDCGPYKEVWPTMPSNYRIHTDKVVLVLKA